MSNLTITNFKCDYHRNGVSGEPFYICIFDSQESYPKHPEWDEKEPRRMTAVVFVDKLYCAVFDLKMLGEENIEFARGNSWRGDYYEDQLRKLIAEWEEEHKDDWKKDLQELKDAGVNVSINVVNVDLNTGAVDSKELKL